MTENYDPYENTIAERVNGILKEEFYLDENFESKEQMEKQVNQALQSIKTTSFNHNANTQSSTSNLNPGKKQTHIQTRKWVH